jgi:type 1 glutamine amidotransferase
MTLHRREALKAAGLGLLGWPALARAARPASESKKVLFFTKSSGFQHSVITRKGDELGHAETILKRLGEAHGMDVTCSKDGRLFDPDRIADWDVFVFYTTGDLTKEGTDKQPPMSSEGLETFLGAVRGGKAGFVGLHSATDTFGTHRGMGGDDPYIQMIGGHFNGHGAQQEAELIVTDPEFPGTKGLDRRFRLNDEWYSQKFQPADLHVIIAHDTARMQGDDYKRPNYPQTWAKAYGDGRVFYTSMGHREDVWENPLFQNLLLGGLSWAARLVDADAAPNASRVTPDFQRTEDA